MQIPEPGFDRSRVKGLVAQLVEIEDEKYATALEVTLEGDIFDPSGTLTGGSRASTGSSVLIKLKKLSDARSQLEAAHKELQALQARRKSQAEAAAQHSAMVKDLKVQEHAVELAQKRL